MEKVFKCKLCENTFSEEMRYLNHKKIHGRKARIFKSDSFGDTEHAVGSVLVNP